MTNDFLNSAHNGEKLWPAKGRPSPRLVPEYPKDRLRLVFYGFTDSKIDASRIVPLLSQLFWRQNLNEAHNFRYHRKSPSSTETSPPYVANYPSTAPEPFDKKQSSISNNIQPFGRTKSLVEHGLFSPSRAEALPAVNAQEIELTSREKERKPVKEDTQRNGKRVDLPPSDNILNAPMKDMELEHQSPGDTANQNREHLNSAFTCEQSTEGPLPRAQEPSAMIATRLPTETYFAPRAPKTKRDNAFCRSKVSDSSLRKEDTDQLLETSGTTNESRVRKHGLHAEDRDYAPPRTKKRRASNMTDVYIDGDRVIGRMRTRSSKGKLSKQNASDVEIEAHDVAGAATKYAESSKSPQMIGLGGGLGQKGAEPHNTSAPSERNETFQVCVQAGADDIKPRLSASNMMESHSTNPLYRRPACETISTSPASTGSVKRAKNFLERKSGEPSSPVPSHLSIASSRPESHRGKSGSRSCGFKEEPADHASVEEPEVQIVSERTINASSRLDPPTPHAALLLTKGTSNTTMNRSDTTMTSKAKGSDTLSSEHATSFTGPSNSTLDPPRKIQDPQMSYWIVRSRHPRLKKSKWDISDLSNKTTAVLFTEAAKIFGTPITHSIRFTLVMDGQDLDQLVKQGDDEGLARMWMDFKSAVRAEVHQDESVTSRVELDPDP
ncbi:uncharacterized protein KY384_004133 [Bacidia gigantensis]|uniref:uncharacterized protein n=1 Tax=Bacidia gigantensis TaxID=2732470 RepID=UPI001D053A36|nr:uncharacterized protein KY384_004133 [Bacidia gigantensis]KAG8530776.1 hypothetical protein KY384_004133 [Bacidia gigantensis]